MDAKSLVAAVKPVLTATLSFLVIGAAFTSGIISELGFEFIPIIDKAELLVSLVAYAAILGVSARITFLMLGVMHDLAPWRQPNKEPGPDRRGEAAIAVLMWWQRLPFIVTTIPLAGLLFVSIKLQDWVGSGRGVTIAVSALATLALSLILIHARRWGPIVAIYLVFVLSTALNLGGTWVEFLRDSAPRVTLHLVGVNAPLEASIVIRSSEGIILFPGGTATARFVPWHQIERLDGKVRSADTEPETPDASDLPGGR